MKKYSFISLLTLTACSSNMSLLPQDYSKKSTNVLFTVQTVKMDYVESVDRQPASISDASSEEEISNKKLYFLTLFQQYNTMKKYTFASEAPSINLCPSFHTEMLDYKQSILPNAKVEKLSVFRNYDLNKITSDDYIALYPELNLPVEIDQTNPRVVDILKSNQFQLSQQFATEIVQRAINIHLTKTYQELKELCETGNSDNYYIFENLVTYVASLPLKANDQSMKTLFKLTVFANKLVIDSLEEKFQKNETSRLPASKQENVENLINDRLGVTWSEQYFSKIKEMRNTTSK